LSFGIGIGGKKRFLPFGEQAEQDLSFSPVFQLFRQTGQVDQGQAGWRRGVVPAIADRQAGEQRIRLGENDDRENGRLAAARHCLVISGR